ncbi:MAG: hypothetical protein GC149_03960 [Gammaproteobacteria bacterium]|nr:hypothetical protein [Gammaproteobacteria bacterium]
METPCRQLVLSPAEAQWVPETSRHLIDVLAKLGVIGPPVREDTPDRFVIGEAFLQLFSFMGCAPSIELHVADRDMIDWLGFVYVHVSPSLAQPRWLVERGMAKPACPHCQRRTRTWQEHYQAHAAALQCPHCQHTASVCDWRWYDAGACARQFVSIVNVYPKESLPTDTLLSQLNEASGVAWRYFYLHAPLITA